MEMIFDFKQEENRLKELVYANAGSILGMKIAMKKEKIDYVKVTRGIKTSYILRRKDINKLIITL